MRPPTEAQLAAWGASLREIDPSTLQHDPEEGPVRWFLGEGGCELFAWLDAAGLAHHIQLVFARVSVEWSREEGLRTGSFMAGAATAGGRYDGYVLQPGLRVDPAVCHAALQLLASSRTGGRLFAPLAEALGSVLTARSAS
jgi:hypothetical protein